MSKDSKQLSLDAITNTMAGAPFDINKYPTVWDMMQDLEGYGILDIAYYVYEDEGKLPELSITKEGKLSHNVSSKPGLYLTDDCIDQKYLSSWLNTLFDSKIIDIRETTNIHLRDTEHHPNLRRTAYALTRDIFYKLHANNISIPCGVAEIYSHNILPGTTTHDRFYLHWNYLKLYESEKEEDCVDERVHFDKNGDETAQVHLFIELFHDYATPDEIFEDPHNWEEEYLVLDSHCEIEIEEHKAILPRDNCQFWALSHLG